MDSKIAGMNLELTNICPYRCPQCYLPFDTSEKIMPEEQALHWIDEAEKNGIQYVNMSGGETLCYPYLDDLVRECARRGMKASVSVSGKYASAIRLQALRDAGIYGICVSLNGSRRQINEKTRQGYDEAIAALENLMNINGCIRMVNYVMHKSNADDLPDLLCLLEKYRVHGLTILGTMPAADGKKQDPPTDGQVIQAAEFLANYQGPVAWIVNSCFYELRNLLPGRHGRDAEGDITGCSAGVTHFSVTPEGLLTPCNHLNMAERYDTIEEYLRDSPIIRRLRARTALRMTRLCEESLHLRRGAIRRRL